MIKIKVGKDGKQYPAYTTMGAFRKYKQLTGKGVEEMASTTESIDFLFCVAQCACKREGVDFPYKDVDEFADDIVVDDFVNWSKQMEGATKRGE